MSENNIYINRELSWLNFNSRVLNEATDKTLPLLERLKFLAIFSSNLDEFFMVRVAGVNQQIDSGAISKDISGLTPKALLKKIRRKVNYLLSKQYSVLNNVLGLSSAKFTICNRNNLDDNAISEIAKYFDEDVFPVLTPVAVDPSHPFPVLNNCSIEIVVHLSKNKSKNKTVKAFVEVPNVLPRFLKLDAPSSNEKSIYVALEDIIILNINKLFAGCKIYDTSVFRLTRDMDFAIDEEGAADLLYQIEKTLLNRKRRAPVRIELLNSGSPELEKWLIKKLSIPANAVYRVEGPLDLASLFQIVSEEDSPDLLEPPLKPLPLLQLEPDKPVFDSIKKHGIIPMFHPFQSFEPVIRFLNEAANDPNVLAIKQTLYRVSGDSPVIKALQRAAESKKQVTVIVELKARFDEEHNIEWAKKLEESGAHVIYGIAGLKIHCKALLVIRKEKKGISRYAHLATGNYNDKTARLYTDIGMFTDDSAVTTDVSLLFNVMTGYSEYNSLRKISSAPFDLRKKFINLIKREIRLSTPRRPGRILAKMNSLTDPEIIKWLNKAASAGVELDLIVRGMCCFKPVENDKNINIISIVDRFLEHSRVYCFNNGGNTEYYLSSADWMPRNLDRRIETLFPVEDDNMKDLIDKVIEFQLKDKVKARRLTSNGNYVSLKSTKKSKRSQQSTYDFFKKLTDSTKPSIKKKLVVFKSSDK